MPARRETLAICISDSIPSCIRAPPPEPEMMISGKCCCVARSTGRVSFSPTTEPMLPMKKAESVVPKATRRARTMPVPVTAASLQPGAGLLLLEFLAIRDLVDEIQRIGRFQIGVPFLEGALVEDLFDPFPGRHVPVIIAFGANAEAFFRFLAEDGRLAAGAASP